MGVYLVHHPLHNFSPKVGGGRLHGNGRLQGTLQYLFLIIMCILRVLDLNGISQLYVTLHHKMNRNVPDGHFHVFYIF